MGQLSISAIYIAPFLACLHLHCFCSSHILRDYSDYSLDTVDSQSPARYIVPCSWICGEKASGFWFTSVSVTWMGNSWILSQRTTTISLLCITLDLDILSHASHSWCCAVDEHGFSLPAGRCTPFRALQCLHACRWAANGREFQHLNGMLRAAATHVGMSPLCRKLGLGVRKNQHCCRHWGCISHPVILYLCMSVKTHITLHIPT